MNSEQVEHLIRHEFDDAQVYVEGAGANYSVTVVSDSFEGMRPVQKQQAVYRALQESISSGAIHAVNIRTFTVAQWESSA
ncbi:MAG: BolA/IbaG family iron-sulfur metabolism protein [Pseudomonadota bacterium]